MATVNITFLRSVSYGGSFYEATDTANVDTNDALQMVTRGDAEYTTPPAATPGNDNVQFQTHRVIAGGTHVWAGGSATADSITVTGLAATDVVQATLVARASTETLVMAAKDVANGQIDLTLSANGTDGETLVDYLVLRPV